LAEFSPIVLTGNNDEEVSVLKEYAEFWKVPFTLASQANEKSVVLTSNPRAVFEKMSNPVIISPMGVDSAREIAKRFGLELASGEAGVRMRVSPSASVSFRTTLHQFSGPNLEERLGDGHNAVLYRVRGSNVYILSVDLISEYRRLLHERMDEDANWKFRLVTRMPLSYSLIPSRIRNRAFKTKQDLVSVQPEVYGPVECLRAIFLASLVTASSGPVPIIRFWRRGKSYALALSHDVETQLGLEDGAARLIEVENELGIRSSWNIPSDRYPLSSQLLVSLAKSGEVGAHDTKHDGKLLFTKGKAKVERVRRCKERLERLSGKEVRGFRAPLLQHSRELVDSLGDAGYEYDSSMPSWEPLSPTSLKPHGVGTLFPFLISEIVEVPVSLPQDHQLIRAGGLGVVEAVNYLIELSAWVKNIGGACVLLVHPDYEFSEGEGLVEYRRLLASFRSDPSCDIMTLAEMARWWANRQRSYIDDSGQIETKLSDTSKNGDEALEVALVTGYGPNGFTIQSPNMINMVETNLNSERRM
jgi:peptidoglycan/xylan/chitin deacetylase (PgdA/CDA1 family)